MSPHLTQLFALLYNEGKIADLDRALQQTRDRMQTSGEANLWQSWHAVVLAAQGDFSGAEAELSNLTKDQAREARRVLVLERARQTKDWRPVVEFYEKRWSETGSAADLLALCEAQMEAGNRSFVAARGQELVKSVATGAALRLGLNAASQCQDWRLCFDLLKENASLFPNGRLPADLRRLQVMCEQALGMLSEAVKDAEDLVHEESNAENLWLLFGVHVALGDLKRAVFPARELVHSKETPPDMLVSVATVMRLEDRELATRALEEAVARDVTGPGSVVQATMLAAQLELDSLMRHLVPKMLKAAETASAGVRAVGLREMLELKHDIDEQFRSALNDWRAGKIPIHVLPRLTNVPLAAWLTLPLSDPGNDGSLSNHFPVFFRHGGRQAASPARRITRLYVDITALHVAHELGILRLVEDAFGPLFILPAARLSLVKQSDDADRNQAKRVAAHLTVAQLLDDKRIEVWEPSAPPAVPTEPVEVTVEWRQALEEMRHRGGLLVDCWPKLLGNGSSFEPGGNIIGCVTSVAEVLNSLERLGKLEASKLSSARERLAPLTRSQATFPAPLAKQALLLEGNLAGQLAEAGVLCEAAAAFGLLMREVDVQVLRAEIAQADNWRRVSAHLTSLREHILASKNYHDVPLVDTSKPNKGPELVDPTERCLRELDQVQPGEGHFVWVDDRHINAHSACQEVPIITSVGVIEELRRLGKVSPDEYHALRHHLRVADFRYIPLTKEEISHHVLRAPIERGQIIETPELAVLRRQTARVLLDSGALQVPPVPFATPNPNGETDVLTSLLHAVGESLIAVFGNPTANNETKFAQADWLLHSLWIEPGHFAALLGRQPPQGENRQLLLGIGDSLLLQRAISCHDLGGVEGRKLYFRWLEARLIADPRRAAAAGTRIRTTLEDEVWRQASTKVERQLLGAVMQDWYLALPKAVSSQAHLPKRTLEKLRIETRPTVSIGQSQFAAEEFWKAAEAAYSGTSASLRPVEAEAELQVVVEWRDEHPVLVLKRKPPGEVLGLQGDILLLMDKSEKRRRDVLRKNPDWFDGLGARAAREPDRIARMPDAVKRVLAVDAALKSSAWHSYRRLKSICLSPPGPTLEQMAPPAPEHLCRFLRVSLALKSGSIRAQMERGARQLIAEVGLIEAFRRCARLPIELPSAIVGEFVRQSISAQRTFLDSLSADVPTPLDRIHQLRLLLLAGETFRAQAKEMANTLLNPEEIKEAAAMIQAVTWSWYQFGRASRGLAPNGPWRLIMSWVHGSSLFGLLRAISAPDKIVDFFREHGRPVPGEMLSRLGSEDDVAFPRQVAPNVLLVTGAAMAFQAAGVDAAAVDGALPKRAETSCFHAGAGTRWPQVMWMHEPSLKENALGSFLGSPRANLLTGLLGAESAAELSSERLQREFEGVISALEERAEQGASWALLGAFLANQRCPVALQKRLRALFVLVPWNLLSANDAIRFIVMHGFAAHAWELGGDEFVEVVQKQVAAEARKLSHLRAEEALQQCTYLLGSAEALARSARPEEASRVFSRVLIACLNEWPAFATLLPGAAGQMLMLSEQDLVNAWPLILRLRHDSAPAQPASSLPRGERGTEGAK